MKYGDARWWGWSRSNLPIPAELRDIGWHYCSDFDEELWQVKPWGVCQWCGLRVEPELWRARLLTVLTERRICMEIARALIDAMGVGRGCAENQ